MTQRKPPGVSFEAWVDRQVREATERGEFDNLPGRGQPLADLDRPRDELWWVRQKMRRENLSYLPPTLALRKEVEDALRATSRAASEAEVRRIVTAVNDRIREANRMPPAGPPLNLSPFDIEQVVHDWHAQRARDPGAVTAVRHRPAETSASPRRETGQPPGSGTRPPRSRRLWRRRRSAGETGDSTSS